MNMACGFIESPSTLVSSGGKTQSPLSILPNVIRSWEFSLFKEVGQFYTMLYSGKHTLHFYKEEYFQ